MRRMIVGFVAAASVITAAVPAAAQYRGRPAHRFEISGLAGWTFSDGVETQPIATGGGFVTGVDVIDGLNGAVSAGFFVNPSVSLEFQWMRQETELRPEGSGTAPQQYRAYTRVDNYHGNVLFHYGRADNKVRPFFLFGLGSTDITPRVQDQDVDASARFSGTLGLGLKGYFGGGGLFGEALGVRLQMRWTPTFIKSEASGVWCDPWYPWVCYVVEDYDYVNQWAFSGGLTMRFGKR